MKASYTYAVRYDVTGICTSPLRTADANAETEAVLRLHNGQYCIQGSSLAGAFREWVKTHADANDDIALFGSQKACGSLRISDGLFSEDTELEIRPRLRIDGKTGSAADGGKFDVAALKTGSEFHFTITWLGCPERLEETETVERMLGAMHCGEILLGAQKSNGFGRVSLRVKRQSYDLFEPAARNSWLADRFSGTDLKLPEETDDSRVTFVLTAYSDSLLVKAPAAEQTDQGSWVPNLKENDTPIIPGSSAKGAIRARVNRIAAQLGLPESLTDGLFGRGANGTDNDRSGVIRFEEILLPESRAQKITRIRINRFTGGVIHGGLFTEEPISGPAELRLSLPACEKAGCMLLLYALRDLGLGLYSLGSGSSIGRGLLKVSELRAEAPGGRCARLTFQDFSVSDIADDTGLVDEWQGALEVIR